MKNNKTEKKKKFKIRVRAVILYKGKLLVVRHSQSALHLALPGGKLEFGEDIIDGLKREIKEELGIIPKVGELLYVHTYTKEHVQSVEFFFEVKNGKDFLKINQATCTHAHEIQEICWVRKGDQVLLLPEDFAKDFREGKLPKQRPKFLNIS